MLDYSQWPQAYHPDFGQLVSYKFEPMPNDANSQVRIAIEQKMRPMVLRDVNKPYVQAAAASALDLGGGDPVLGVWKTIKPHMRFQQDIETARRLQAVNPYGADDNVETFIAPEDQAKLIALRGQGVEDCDGFTMYGACLLMALGVPVTFCTVSAEQEHPSVYSHVYLVAYWNGMRIPLDLSHGKYPGWECPNAERKREWPVSAGCGSLFPLLIATAVGGYLAWRAGH
jgi:hypothetical protein